MGMTISTPGGGAITLEGTPTVDPVTIKLPLKPFVTSINGIEADADGNVTSLDILPNSQTVSYTLALSDRGKSIDTTSDVTVPNSSSVNFPIGASIMVTNTTATGITIKQDTNVILRQAGTVNVGNKLLNSYGVATLRKVATDTWIVSGSGSSVLSMFVFNKTISVNTNQFNLKLEAIAAGWDQIAPLDANITINSGISVYSNSSGTAAFTTGVGFPVSSLCKVINNGRIVGCGGAGATSGNGGAGGLAISASTAMQITNNGTVGGGGGGGGYGNDVGYSSYGTCAGASVGGSGEGLTAATNATRVSRHCQYGGYQWSGYDGWAQGGNGGALGNSGGAGTGSGFTSTSGGAAGACTQGNSNITWSVAGTRYGALN